MENSDGISVFFENTVTRSFMCSLFPRANLIDFIVQNSEQVF